jgi:pre-mRNA-processing factor 40
MPDDVLVYLDQVQEEMKTGTPGPPATGYLYSTHFVSSINTAFSQPRAISAPGFTPVGGATQGALVPMGGADTSSSTPSSQPLQANGTNGGTSSLTVGPHTGNNGLPLAANSVLPARPHLPDDPVIPHNGFVTVEEGEKAFIHLLRKAGVDANWTWDQTMRAIITDPLYKALNTLAEKKSCWEKV